MTISSSTVSGVLMAIIRLKATNPFNNAYRSVKEIICELDLCVCIICFVSAVHVYPFGHEYDLGHDATDAR